MANQSVVVRLERQPHRDAVGRLRQAYYRLSQRQSLHQPQPVQEVCDGLNSRIVRPGINPPAGARSDN